MYVSAWQRSVDQFKYSRPDHSHDPRRFDVSWETFFLGEQRKTALAMPHLELDGSLPGDPAVEHVDNGAQGPEAPAACTG